MLPRRSYQPILLVAVALLTACNGDLPSKSKTGAAEAVVIANVPVAAAGSSAESAAGSPNAAPAPGASLAPASLQAVADSSGNAAPNAAALPTVDPGTGEIDAQAKRDTVSIQRNLTQMRLRVPSPQHMLLGLGDGVDVDRQGYALLSYQNLWTVEVLRNGSLEVHKVAGDPTQLAAEVRMRSGALVNTFDPAQLALLDLRIKGDLALVVALNASVAAVEEETTPLQWTVVLNPPAGLEVPPGATSVAPPTPAVTRPPRPTEIGVATPTATPQPGQTVPPRPTGIVVATATATPQPGQTLVPQPTVVITVTSGPVTGTVPATATIVPAPATVVPITGTLGAAATGLVPVPGSLVQVTANGATTVAYTGSAVWSAPIGPPSHPIAIDPAAVSQWLTNLANGIPQPEIGEILLPPADVQANICAQPPLLALNQPFALEDVSITLAATSAYGPASYWIEDCNGDGLQDIAMRNGSLRLDFRAVPARVRALDVSVVSWAGGASGYLAVLDPAAQEMNRQTPAARLGSEQLVSLRSEPGYPYHYADLTLKQGCFLGFSLTPPQAGGGAGAPRRPAAETFPIPGAQCELAGGLRMPKRTFLRTGPDDLYPPSTLVEQGELLAPLGQNPQGTWLQVKAPNGKLGWTPLAFLSCVDIRCLPVIESSPPPVPTATPAPPPVKTVKPVLAPTPIPVPASTPHPIPTGFLIGEPDEPDKPVEIPTEIVEPTGSPDQVGY